MSTALGDVLRVTAVMRHDTSGVIANVFEVRLKTLVSSPLTDANTLIDMGDYMDGMYDTIDALMNDDVDFIDINVFNITQDRPYGNTPWPTLTSGALSTDVLPAQSAVFVQGNSGFSRSWARKFLGGFTELHNSPEGYVQSALTSAIADWAIAWLVGFTSGSGDIYEPVFYSTKVDDWRVVIEAIIRNVWATIRRRRIGRGA